MSAGNYYDMCCKYKGRAVKITTRDGHIHRGIIQHVDNRRVYLRPMGSPRNLGGFGYGWGYGYGGFGLGIALGAIGTLALLPFFFW